MVHSTLADPVLFRCITGTDVHACIESCSIGWPQKQVIGVDRPIQAAYNGEIQALRRIKGEIRGWAVSVP